ncbi:hypothetical protein BDU57DRAFT_538912 [Ampelomyces quisqualis]|uniref:Uncharacterized protein n=1 Tax=Ampelomyces quisqualis TaxID=50730 RepID=A0A6A5QMR5_AMPQU|nr:hypothetical protein BDU57DRAFT_538912 [Ampelomyces quisqualis]
MTHGRQLNRIIASKMNRSLIEKKIVIHQLIFIAALVLIPLLTWHIATLNFFEDYRMQVDDKERITKKQMLVGIEELMTRKEFSRSKIALWAAVWILVGGNAVTRTVTMKVRMLTDETDFMRHPIRAVVSGAVSESVTSRDG